MDIIILTTYDEGGAGLHSIYQKDMLIKLGYSVQIICVEKTSEDKNTKGLLKKKSWELLKYKLIRKKHRILYGKFSERYAFIHSFMPNQKNILKSKVWPKSCKLIICNFLSGMLTYKTLHKIWLKYKKIPIIFYGVDMELYTGGCHYSRECINYQKLCDECPAMPKSKSKEIRDYFLDKHKYIKMLKNHIVISSSEEMDKQLKKSFLFSTSIIRKILMPVNKNIYGNYDKRKRDFIRKSNGWEDSFVIMIRSSSEERKGCRQFIKALNLLSKKDPAKFSRIQLIVVGDSFLKKKLSGLNLKIFFAGYVGKKSELADLYAAADIFVNPSLADSGPSMLAQATMSGTPSITNNVGLAKDLIYQNGIILSNTKFEQLLKAISKMMDFPKEDLDAMRKIARGKALKLITEEKYIQDTKNLMEEFVKK